MTFFEKNRKSTKLQASSLERLIKSICFKLDGNDRQIDKLLIAQVKGYANKYFIDVIKYFLLQSRNIISKLMLKIYKII